MVAHDDRGIAIATSDGMAIMWDPPSDASLFSTTPAEVTWRVLLMETLVRGNEPDVMRDRTQVDDEKGSEPLKLDDAA